MWCVYVRHLSAFKNGLIAVWVAVCVCYGRMRQVDSMIRERIKKTKKNIKRERESCDYVNQQGKRLIMGCVSLDVIPTTSRWRMDAPLMYTIMLLITIYPDRYTHTHTQHIRVAISIHSAGIGRGAATAAAQQLFNNQLTLFLLFLLSFFARFLISVISPPNKRRSCCFSLHRAFRRLCTRI